MERTHPALSPFQRPHANGDGEVQHVVGCAPPEPGPEFKIVQLRGNEAVDGVILSPAVWGVMTHWNTMAGPKGRSERCTKVKGHCSGCERELPSRWKGYVHYFDFEKKAEAFLEITPEAFKKLEREAPPGVTLRGLRLRAKRSSSSVHGRLNVELGLFHGKIDSLPPPRDPEPILETLWAWRR